MSDFIARLEDEAEQLKDKHTKLVAFMESDKFSQVSDRQQTFLTDQEYYMGKYLRILEERIVDLKEQQ